MISTTAIFEEQRIASVITNVQHPWRMVLSARERLQARLYERLRWQQQEMQPIPLEDIDDTCVIFWSMRIRRRLRMEQEEMRRRLRSCSRHAPLALQKVVQIEWI